MPSEAPIPAPTTNSAPEGAEAGPSAPAVGQPPSRRLVRRAVTWTFRTLLVLGAAGGLAWGGIYWSERPLREAEQAWKAENYAEAEGLAALFLESHPDHGGAKAIRACALVRLGRASEAVGIFDDVGAATARDTHVWAEGLLSLGRFTEALLLLQHVLEVDPTNADALYEITTCRMRLRQYRDAEQSARQFAALPGWEARGRLLLATIEHDLANYSRAADECARVLKLEPDGEHLQIPPYEVFILYGRALLSAGRPQEALPILARSVLVRPTADGYSFLAEAAKLVGESARAESLWQSALSVDNRHVAAREGLAGLAIASGDGKRALQWLQPLESASDLSASAAYLFQQAATLAKDATLTAKWQARADALRKRERLTGTLDRFVADSPGSFWSAVIRAYRFAEGGNWEEARALLGQVPPEAVNGPFVKELLSAVNARGPLPPLDQIPLKDH